MVELAEIMTADVFTVAPDTPVAAVAAAMVKRRLGSAIVMQGQMLVGIFTERDVLRAAASGGDLARSPVSRWMTRDPETAGPDVDSEQAAKIGLAEQGPASVPGVRPLRSRQRITGGDRRRHRWVGHIGLGRAGWLGGGAEGIESRLVVVGATFGESFALARLVDDRHVRRHAQEASDEPVAGHCR